MGSSISNTINSCSSRLASFFFLLSCPVPQHATIVPRSHYLPGFLHPVELDRDLGEGRSLVGPVPPALPHQLITGRGEGRTRWRLMPQGRISQQRQDKKRLPTYTSSSQFLGFSILKPWGSFSQSSAHVMPQYGVPPGERKSKNVAINNENMKHTNTMFLKMILGLTLNHQYPVSINGNQKMEILCIPCSLHTYLS